VRVKRIEASNEELLSVDASTWRALESNDVDLVPSPVAMTAAVSPQTALSKDHGKIRRVQARLAHNGETLNVRLAWKDPDKDDRIDDLDRFADAAAAMFPLLEDANPLTMGDESRPVNAWFWKADQPEPFDVIARGYATSQRRPAATSGLAARASHGNGEWTVVFQRPLQAGDAEVAGFEPGASAKIAFAVWEGSNAERGGQKSMSGVFLPLELDR